jgi:hypothetical protein
MFGGCNEIKWMNFKDEVVTKFQDENMTHHMIVSN